MEETAAALAATDSPVDTGSDIVTPVAAGDGPLTAREATNSLLDFRRKRDAKSADGDGRGDAEDASTAGATDGVDQQGEGTAAAQQGDNDGAARAAAAAEVEPPRSWSKDDKELFKALPAETRQRIADREKSRETDFLRRQNEATEKAKGIDATRAQYEQSLATVLTMLQGQQQNRFADIKTLDDVERLAREDWPRYAEWDAGQKRLAAVLAEAERAAWAKEQERGTRWNDFASAEDRLAAEKWPELGNVKTAAAMTQVAASVLNELGFTDAELSEMWNGRRAVSLRDHRVQGLLRDAVKYRQAHAAVRAAPKAVPSVQRPGAAQPSGAADDQRVKALNDKLAQSGSLRDAAALLVAQRARSRRSA